MNESITMMDTTIIRLADLPRQRWKNNGGWTHEIARGGGEDWLWRVSVADVESDGAFSLFPGMLRELLILSGEGVALQFENGQTIALTPEQPRLRFDGDQPIYSRLLDGAVRDFNLIWQPARVDTKLSEHEISGLQTLAVAEEETLLLFVRAGRLQYEQETLLSGDSLLLNAGQAHTLTLEAQQAQMIVVRLRMRQ